MKIKYGYFREVHDDSPYGIHIYLIPEEQIEACDDLLKRWGDSGHGSGLFQILCEQFSRIYGEYETFDIHIPRVIIPNGFKYKRQKDKEHGYPPDFNYEQETE